MEKMESNDKIYVKKGDLEINVAVSVVTFGLWSIIWQWRITNNAATIVKQQKCRFEFIKLIILNILTSGLYACYWYYKIGLPNDDLNKGKNRSVKYLLITIFMLLSDVMVKCLDFWDTYLNTTTINIITLVNSIIGIILWIYIFYNLQKDINRYVSDNFGEE